MGSLLTIFDNFGNFWQFLILFDNWDNWDNFEKTILQTCDIWDTGYSSDNWEPEFMTIFGTWHLIVTLDSIRNSCDVLMGNSKGVTFNVVVAVVCQFDKACA